MAKDNAFIRSAQRAQDEQEVIRRGQRPKTSYKPINIRIPADLLLHRVNTGESITALITRLLERELKQG